MRVNISLKKKTRAFLYTYCLMNVVFSGVVNAQSIDRIDIVTGNDYKPFSDQTLPNGGLATEILAAALASQNVTLDLEWMAWDAGFDATVTGEFAGTLPYFYTDERAETHLYSEPIYSINRHLFFRTDRQDAPIDVEAIDGQTVCLPNGYAISSAIQPLLDNGRIGFNRPDDMTVCFDRLEKGQVDYVSTNLLQGWDLVRETRGLGPDNVGTSSFVIESNQLHVIISKARSNAEAIKAVVDAGLAAIRADGTYDRLVARHLELPPASLIADSQLPEPAAGSATDTAGYSSVSDLAASGQTVSVELADGSRFMGIIQRQDEDAVVIDTIVGSLTVPQDQIARVEVQAPPQAGATGAASTAFSSAAAGIDGSGAASALVLAGSNTIGASLAPRLVELYTDQIGSDLLEWRIDGGNERTALIEGGGPDSLQQISIRAHGSNTGFRDLIDGTADIAMASRPIRDTEAQALQGQGDMLAPNAEHVLALDGLAIIVHPDNPVRRLSRNVVRAIFAGEIANWRDLAAFGDELGLDPASLPDAPIEVLARDDNSGTFDSFERLVLSDGSALTPGAERFESNPELADQVAARPQAIGFSGLGHVRNSRALAIDECGVVIEPNPFDVKAEEYPLSRRLYLYRPPESANPWSGEFVEAATGAIGQTIVEQEGFVGLDIAVRDAEDSEAFWSGIGQRARQVAGTLDEIEKVTNGARRLTSTFRFNSASSTLDARALRDLRRMARYVREEGLDPGRVMLLGYADSRGGYDSNMALSLRRAQSVAAELEREGLTVGEVHGFSEELPVACNDDERGWSLNRRVEVWLKP